MRRVLIIDDDPLVLKTVSAMLQGCECIVASDALAGIEQAQNERFDLVMIDMRMPGIDGLEAVKAISHVSPPIPIIAMSGAPRMDVDYDVLAQRFGSSLFLPKPFNRAQLLTAVERALGGRPR